MPTLTMYAGGMESVELRLGRKPSPSSVSTEVEDAVTEGTWDLTTLSW
jgi:hypothetical protein